MSDVIRVDDVPGLREFVVEVLGFDPWSNQSRWDRWWQIADAKNYEPILPLDVPAARDALVRWFVDRARCHWCSRHDGPDRCPECLGSGYLLRVYDLSWARDNGPALAKSVRLVMQGKPPLKGVLGEWCQPYGSDRAIWQRKSDACRSDECISEVHYLHGWQADHQEGRETGDAGKAAADASVIDTYWLAGGPFEASDV